jgi:hypothetical protein
MPKSISAPIQKPENFILIQHGITDRMFSLNLLHILLLSFYRQAASRLYSTTKPFYSYPD